MSGRRTKPITRLQPVPAGITALLNSGMSRGALCRLLDITAMVSIRKRLDGSCSFSTLELADIAQVVGCTIPDLWDPDLLSRFSLPPALCDQRITENNKDAKRQLLLRGAA